MTIVNRRTLLSSAALCTLAIVALSLMSHTAAARSLDTDVERTLNQFQNEVRGTRELVETAAAILVFPTVIKAGMGIGGEYGEGVLLV